MNDVHIFFPALLYSYKMSLKNEHVHSHILHTGELLKIRNLLSKNGPKLILVTAIYIVI